VRVGQKRKQSSRQEKIFDPGGAMIVLSICGWRP
jgi:hypothetical protein